MARHFNVHNKLVDAKNFIGLNDGRRPGNFVTFRPKKSFMRVKFEALSPIEPWVKRLEDSGLESDVKNDDLRVVLTPKDFEDNKELMTQLLQELSGNTKKIDSA